MEIGWPVEVITSVAPPVPGRICNVSRTGVLVSTAVAISVRRLVRLCFTVHPGRECAARGAVVRIDDGIAIDFIEMNDEMRDFIDATTSLRPELLGDFLSSVMAETISIT